MEFTNDAYRVQGLDLHEICDNFGTPVYVYDAEKIVNQLESLKKAFAGNKLKIKFAAKSLTNLAILKLIRKHGGGIDVVSIQEAQLALKAGFEAKDILFTPNCVGFDEICEGVKLGLMINIDNLSILKKFGETYGNSKPCCIRLNPHIMAGGNKKISTGHADSKFGISIYQLPDVLELIDKYGMDVIGLHVHTGSDILDADVFMQMSKIIFEAANNFAELKFIDFGSGFKVAYQEGDIVTNIEELGKKLSSAFREFCQEYGTELEMWFEPGKYLVSEAGLFLVKTNVVKATPARTFVGVNSGLNHFLRPMMYDAHHDIVNISNPSGEKHVYSVVGYICETDNLGWDRQLHEVREGDLLAFKNAGAYCFSMASNYNSRLRPPEVLIIDGEAKLIRKRETMEDITRNLVDIEI